MMIKPFLKFSVLSYLTLLTHISHTFNPTTLEMLQDDLVVCCFSSKVVFEAIHHLKKGKLDHFHLESTHFIHAVPIFAEPLSISFSVLLRHSYLPPQLVNCTLVPVPKPCKNPSSSDSFRPIALASSLSKILEWCILLQYSPFPSTSDLQFDFKKDMSTTLCTGVLKQVRSCQIHS